MAILQNRTSQLTTILQAWNELGEDSQKKSINFISEFILSASLFQKFSGDKNLETQLTRFQENYKKLFGSDLTKLGTSDLSQKNVGILNKINEIDLQKIELPEKKEKISSLFAEKRLNIQKFREKLLAESLDKYSHAHFKVMRNYGDFIEHLEANLDSEKKKEFHNLKTKLSTAENEKEFFKNLVLLNNCADIPTNFDKLTTKFGIDGLEEHTLINQGTLYRSYLDRGESINKILGVYDPANALKSTQEYFVKNGNFKSIKVDTKKILEDFHSQEESKKPKRTEGESLQLTLGFEIEGVLTVKGGFEAEKERLENLSEFQKIKRSLADNDARIKMRETYGFSSSNIGHTPNPILLYSEDELDDFKTKHRNQYGDKISIIEEYLEGEKKNYPQEKDKFNKAIKNIALLSQEEIFFLDLFYKRKDDAKTNKIAIDDLFDWRDTDKNHQEKFLGILQEIAEKGGFYQKTLDMIRVTEFAIGEFSLEDAKENFSKSLKDFRKVAGEHGLRLKDRGVQINIGAIYEKETLEISTENSGKDLKVSTNQLTVIVIKAIQNALKRLLEDDPNLQREGQDIVGVGVGVDRKKGLIGETAGTDYIKTFSSAHSNYSSPFALHRYSTSKSGMTRLTSISGDNKSFKIIKISDEKERRERVAVLEVRLIGNNPHTPYPDGFPRLIFNGAEVISEKFIKYLQEESSKLSPEKKDIYERVSVEKNGAIDSLPIIFPENKVERAPPATLEKPYAEELQEKSVGSR
jgi:hypothetical protein